jgi:hypothetical protein
LLGLSAGDVELLSARAQASLGRRSYAIRLAALLLATTPVVRRAVPPSLRRRAIRPFIYAFISGPSENLLYAQLRGDRQADVRNA